ncbi:MAG TPA: DUF4339 domain-containing protein [Candidatus Sulfotelmatobacter sp.]|nr:DUF4339 domain-containing protein [Candidatus Sulfotelmatobacter sp.]
MRYFILRNGEQYGPYSKVEVQRYLRTGEIYPGDLGRSQGINQWLPVSQLLGTGAPPLPSPATDSDSASGGHLPPHDTSPAPEPPGLHWAIALLLAVLTLGFFGWIWSLVLARWVRRADPDNRAKLLLISALAASIGAITMLLSTPNRLEHVALIALLQFAAVVLFEIAIFGMRASILQHYEDLGIPLSLNSAETFFFNVVYFQFKFNRIHHAQSTTQWMTVHHS